jgi:UDP-N-acetylmuramoyl-L-alanyl-D-glutamate--2,6-diaminopimelate ligase
MAELSGGRVITVLGCGGDRDVTKRPVMAREAKRLSDVVWITSDNPRNEPADAIARDMLEGLDDPTAVEVQLDRGLAIAQAIAQARSNDWVVVAGKGHETHQEVAGVRHPFSDAVHAQANLNAWRPA